MPTNIPRKQTRACSSCSKALVTTAMAIADAKQRGNGVNLETTFPEGRMYVKIGMVTVSVSQPKRKKGGVHRAQ